MFDFGENAGTVNMIDPMEEFFFDLHGYTILHAALDTAHMGAINAWVDGLPSLTQGTWHGPMEVQSYGGIEDACPVHVHLEAVLARHR